MVTQQAVLAFIAARTDERRAVGAKHLADEFRLSLEGARGHLRRLWRERLIETSSPRPPRYRFRLEVGESILLLHFRVAARGRDRLRWYEDPDDDSKGGLLRFV
jgi:predicted ArsR family transcriptional regulator